MKIREYDYPVSCSLSMRVSKEQIWDLISQAGYLELCHPFCKSNSVEEWSGDKSIDYINYYNNLTFARTFTRWIDGQGYDLLIGKSNDRKSKVLWRINELHPGVSELKITIHPHRIKNCPRFLEPLVYFFYTRIMLKKYLRSVLKGIKWYVLSYRVVKKNQFGSHSWFSK